jgi:hypothetical protein
MLPPLDSADLSLTLEQDFAYQQYKKTVENISIEELRAIALSTIHLSMVQHNLIKKLSKQAAEE